MSFEALAWAGKCKPGSASQKLVLLALADRHNTEIDGAYPSIAWLVEFTDLNRKTVINCLTTLETGGFISDSGERRGNTRQIKVYRLHLETIPKTELSQKRNSSKITNKQSQKRDTEPSREPFTPDIPDGISRSPSENENSKLKPEHVVEVWNELAGKLGRPPVRLLTPERRQVLKARIAGYSIDEFQEAIGKVERSPFLRGEKGWKGITFDWFVKKANFQKILEGNYDG
jgi:hypothetical protein